MSNSNMAYKALELEEKINHLIEKTINLFDQKPFLKYIFLSFLFLMLTIARAKAQDVSATLEEASGSVVTKIKCALRGNVGWLFIALAALACLYDYFISKQGTVLIVAIVVVLIILILGQVLPGTCD